MNCAHCEQLFDAYLDGELTGSLRLEFDAHRLRCPRCQQTLAMLETVGHVIASDSRAPELAEDFTARIMQQIKTPPVVVKPRRFRLLRPSLRVAVVAGAVLQAAAILVFAILLDAPAPKVSPRGAAAGAAAVVAGASNDSQFQSIRGLVIERLEDRLWDMRAAGTNLTSDVVNVARYLNIMLPDDVARESVKMAGVNPWQGLWDTLMAPPEEEPDPAPVAENVHSI